MFVIDEDEAKLVREAFERVAGGREQGVYRARLQQARPLQRKGEVLQRVRHPADD